VQNSCHPRKAIQMNLPVLIQAARVWVDVLDFQACGTPRTPPLPSLASEALVPGAKHERNRLYIATPKR
jgi:hypothetical protein